MALLGISHRMQWIELPGNLDALSNPFVIGLAIVMYLAEFVADKVPYVDSLWDSVHTIIRPVGGAVIGYLATADAGSALQIPAALFSGSVSLDSHLTKATSRAAINTSPEPVTNLVASVTEDISVAGMMYLIIKHPIIAGLAVIAFIVFSIWFLKKMFHFVKKIFKPEKKQESETSG